MANPEHLGILLRGVDAWNQWRIDYPTVLPDLRKADLYSANLRSIDFRHADLGGARLVGARLNWAMCSQAYISGTDLERADLTAADLRSARLNGCSLKTAQLTDADLTGAVLRNSDLAGANVSGAIFAHTVLVNVDLRSAEGLDSVQHRGPSSIGVDTIYRSSGKIPQSFLRGCGIPDNFIAFMDSLAGSALEFYSCFISYSTRDQAF